MHPTNNNHIVSNGHFTFPCSCSMQDNTSTFRTAVQLRVYPTLRPKSTGIGSIQFFLILYLPTLMVHIHNYMWFVSYFNENVDVLQNGAHAHIWCISPPTKNIFMMTYSIKTHEMDALVANVCVPFRFGLWQTGIFLFVLQQQCSVHVHRQKATWIPMWAFSFILHGHTYQI